MSAHHHTSSCEITAIAPAIWLVVTLPAPPPLPVFYFDLDQQLRDIAHQDQWTRLGLEADLEFDMSTLN